MPEEMDQSVVVLGFLLLQRNTMMKMEVGEERVYWLTLRNHSLFIIRRSWDRISNRAETWRQKMMQRPWKVITHWPAFFVVLFFEIGFLCVAFEHILELAL